MNLPNNGRRLPRFLMIAFVTAQLGSLVARADITYAVDTTITSAANFHGGGGHRKRPLGHRNRSLL